MGKRKTEQRYLGRTQKVILEYLTLNGPKTSQQVGDDLYHQVSSAATTGTAKSKEVRRKWASRTLNILEKKGLVKFRIAPELKRGMPTKLWYDSEVKECPECKGALMTDSNYPNDLLCARCNKVFDAKTLEFVEDF
jgi:hypothetical protein